MTGSTLDRDFEKSRKRIARCLSRYFDGRAAGLAAVNAWGADFTRRIRPFVLGGKMIRGGLILIAHDRLGGKAGPDAVKAAAAMELFHSAFLIHDDIMDDDPLRRGKPSIHVQYAAQARRKGVNDAPGFGRAAALCAGDVLLFMGREILASLAAPAPDKARVLSLFGRELAHVGPAQVQDVYSGRIRRPVSRAGIYRLYAFKTARYTYSLPLAAGAILAGAGQSAIRGLEDIGLDLGLVVQIKDAEIGMFGSPSTTGKPVGSDVGEGKKTLYYFYLSRARGPRAAALFGKRRPAAGDISRLNALLRTEKIPERIEADVRRIAGRCARRIREASLPSSMKTALSELLASSLKRKA